MSAPPRKANQYLSKNWFFSKKNDVSGRETLKAQLDGLLFFFSLVQQGLSMRLEGLIWWKWRFVTTPSILEDTLKSAQNCPVTKTKMYKRAQCSSRMKKIKRWWTMHLVKTNIYTVIIQTCNTEGVQINKIRPLFFYYSNEGVLRSVIIPSI